MRQLLLLICFCALISATLVGCGGDKNIKDAPYEDVPLVDAEGDDLSDADAEQLYQAGHDYLYNGDPEEALRVYSAVQSRFPFSPYQTQAALEGVTALYQLKKYEEAVSTADRFIKQHPRHPNVDYLYYLRGLANYHRNDPGLLDGDTDQRDLSYLKQAFADFRLLIRNYPNSVYAKDAQLHMIEIRNRLAKFELGVAEFYLKRRAYVAAARRSADIIQRYQRTTATPRALEIMQESYIQLGLPAMARDSRAILQASYPDYILNRDEFYLARAEKAKEGKHNPLAWLWSWNTDTDEGRNAATRDWLEGKPAAIIGQKKPNVPSAQANKEEDEEQHSGIVLSGPPAEEVKKQRQQEKAKQDENANESSDKADDKHNKQRKGPSPSQKWLEGGASKAM